MTVATTGTDLDPNGYTVVATLISGPGSWSVAIGTSDPTAMLRLATARYAFSLYGVAANCGPDLGPRELDVVSGTEQTVDFAVVCEPARRLAYVQSFNAGTLRHLHRPLQWYGHRPGDQRPGPGFRPCLVTGRNQDRVHERTRRMGAPSTS